MQVQELVAYLSTLPANQEVLVEDLNGLHWELTPQLVRSEDNIIVIGSRSINEV